MQTYVLSHLICSPNKWEKISSNLVSSYYSLIFHIFVVAVVTWPTTDWHQWQWEITVSTKQCLFVFSFLSLFEWLNVLCVCMSLEVKSSHVHWRCLVIVSIARKIAHTLTPTTPFFALSLLRAGVYSLCDAIERSRFVSLRIQLYSSFSIVIVIVAICESFDTQYHNDHQCVRVCVIVSQRFECDEYKSKQ